MSQPINLFREHHVMRNEHYAMLYAVLTVILLIITFFVNGWLSAICKVGIVILQYFILERVIYLVDERDST